MKKILGLDIGTTSIGWAYVHEAEHTKEQSNIIELGVRVNPLTVDEQKEFTEGKACTTNTSRRLKRSMRRNLQRYKLRRQQLIKLLLESDIIQPSTILHEQGKGTTFETLRLRALAANERIELEQLARVFLSINRKRGYRSSRKVNNGQDGQFVDGIKLARELYEQGLTPGQWLYQRLKEHGLKTKVDFYRSDLEEELRRIWQNQRVYYPEVLTDELFEKIQGKGNNDTNKILYEYSKVEATKNEGKKEEKQHRALRWRAESVTQQLTLGELWSVVSDINKAISISSGYLGAISDRNKQLALRGLTVGQYLYAQLQENRHNSLRNQVFYRKDYLDEFNRIWETQAKFHPQLTDDLKTELRDVVIFYQRKLKSQKRLINFCELESTEREVHHTNKYDKDPVVTYKTKYVGPRVAPRSSPLFQEFKIWQNLANVIIRPQGSLKRKPSEEDNIYNLSFEQKQQLFEELNVKGNLSAKQALNILKLASKDWELNYDVLEGNSTNASLYKVYLQIAEREGCDLEKSLNLKSEKWEMKDIDKPAKDIINLIKKHFEMLGIKSDLLTFDASLEGKAFSQQSSYALWHLLYSYEEDDSPSGNDTLYRLLIKKYGFTREHCLLLGSVSFVQDYGNLSSKALRKLLPYMPEHTYSEACSLAGYRHSKSSLTYEELQSRPLLDKLELLPKGSLRQPVVEKILNQLINLVNALVNKYSSYDEAGNVIERFRFDEIRIELARELKSNAKDRATTHKEIGQNERRNKQITEILRSEFGIMNPSRNDIIRYRLYQELSHHGYKDLYSNTEITREVLFSSEIDIEHIIPKSIFYDDSFSNKTLAYKKDNLKKSNRTAFDYMVQESNKDLEHYKARIKELQDKGHISKAKAAKLLKSQSDLGDGFTDRDLRTTQYINRKAHEILFGITRSVVATSGKVTARLRQDWGLTNIMKELNLDKYRSLGLTESLERRSGESVEVIKDWTKRNDHRHHAMDALTVAFTKRTHIQYLNTVHAKATEDSECTEELLEEYLDKDGKVKFSKSGTKRDIFRLPMSNFRTEAKRHLERILISHKAKNKVVTRNRNKIQGHEDVQICLTPRGQLHEETIYGKKKRLEQSPRLLGKKFTLKQVELIANPQIKQVVKDHIAQYPNIEKALDSKTLKKDPILYKGDILSEVFCYEEVYTIRKPIDSSLKIENVLDKAIQEILYKRLKEYGGDSKKAFSNLEENPIWLNEEQGICIKRVTVKAYYQNLEALRTKRTLEGELQLNESGHTIPIDYIQTGNNHHIAIYRDADGKLHEHIVPFMEAVTRASNGLSIIDKYLNKDLGWEFLFTLKGNEIFVFPNPRTGFDPHEINLLDPQNKALISPNLYRVQRISSRDYWFRHHLETTVNSKVENLTFKRISTLHTLKDCIKVRLNHLGDIVHVGEY